MISISSYFHYFFIECITCRLDFICIRLRNLFGDLCRNENCKLIILDILLHSLYSDNFYFKFCHQKISSEIISKWSGKPALHYHVRNTILIWSDKHPFEPQALKYYSSISDRGGLFRM